MWLCVLKKIFSVIKQLKTDRLMAKSTKKAKGEKKMHPVLETVMGVMKTDYSLVLVIVKEQKERIAALPKGKEKNFLQQDLDDWLFTINNQIETKTGMMARMGKTEDPLSYVFTKAEMDDVYEKLKDVDFDGGGDGESAVPNAR